jgi:hypothetical protein
MQSIDTEAKRKMDGADLRQRHEAFHAHSYAQARDQSDRRQMLTSTGENSAR